jgi:hypothetical protein
MSDERQDQREARREESCESKIDLTRLSGASVSSSRRRTPDCDVPVPGDPDVLGVPGASPADTTVALGNPASFIIVSHVPDVSCADVEGVPPFGGPTSPLAAIRVELTLDWNDVPDITDTQLDYINLIDSFDLAPVKNGTVEVIRSITRLTFTQSSWVKIEIERLQEAADAQAYNIALTQLDCYWKNEEQSAACEIGALTSWDPDTLPLPHNPSVVVVGTILSRISQEDADGRAAAQAESALVCVWGNVELTLTCAGLGLGASAGGIVNYTVPVNTVFSGVSQEEADAQAQTLALSQLECFYSNAPISAKCVPDDVTGPERDQLLSPVPSGVTGPAILETNTPGVEIEIPAGYFRSLTSQADADSQATNLQNALLRCNWGNEYIPPACPSLQAVDTGALDYLFNSPSVDLILSVDLSYNLPVEAGTFVSGVSAADAQAQAAAYGLASSLCIYCNPEVPPLCSINSDPSIAADSVDETLGLPASTVCSTDASLILNQATQLAVIPAESKEEKACRWGNTEFVYTCSDYAEAKEQSPADLSPQTAANSVKIPARLFLSDVSQTAAQALAELYAQAVVLCLFCSEAISAKCPEDLEHIWAEAPGSDSNPVEVAACQFQSVESKDEANALRDTYVAALMNCIYTAAGTATCVALPDTREFTIDGVINGDSGKFLPLTSLIAHPGPYAENGGPPGQVAVWNVRDEDGEITGQTTTPPTMTVPHGVVLSDSYATAWQQANDMARAQLNCQHTNWVRTMDSCPEVNQKLLRTSSVGIGKFEDISTEAANVQAEMMALALVECQDCQPLRIVAVPLVGAAEVSICDGNIQAWGGGGGGGGGLCVPCMDALGDGDNLSTAGVVVPNASLGWNHYWLVVYCVADVPTLKVVIADARNEPDDGCHGAAEEFWYYLGSVEVKQIASRTVARTTPAATSNTTHVIGNSSHPFKGTVTSPTSIKIAQGEIITINGGGGDDGNVPSYADSKELESVEFEVAELAAAGSIWLEISGDWSGMSYADYFSGGPTLKLQRFVPTGVAFVDVLPIIGPRWDDNFPGKKIFRKILDFDTIGGELVITRQVTRSDIQLSEFKLLSEQ